MKRHVAIVENLLVQPLGDEAVLLNLNDEKYYTLNGIGFRIWEVLSNKEAETVDEIVKALCDEYDADEAVVRRDVESFIQRLQDLTLIQVNEV